MIPYPIYIKKSIELHNSEAEGDYTLSDFVTLITELKDSDIIENSTEIGILKLVDSKGTKELSSKQGQVLQKIYDRFSNLTCSDCGSQIPVSEIVNSLYNGERCSYCIHRKEKIDSE